MKIILITLFLALIPVRGGAQEITRDSALSIQFISDYRHGLPGQLTAYRVRSTRGNLGLEVECLQHVESESATCEGLREGAYLVAVDFTHESQATTTQDTFTALYPKGEALLVIGRGEHRRLVWDLRTERPYLSEGTIKGDTNDSTLHVYLSRFGMHVPAKNLATLDPRTGAFKALLLQGTSSILMQAQEKDGKSRMRPAAASSSVDEQELFDLDDWAGSSSIDITADAAEGWHPKAVYLEQGGREYNSTIIHDNVFHVAEIPHGLYSVRVKAPNPLFVSSLTIEGSPNPGRLLWVSGNVEKLQISAEIALSANFILGFVASCENGAPAKSLTLYDGFETTSFPVEQDGSFRLVGLPPGHYRVTGWSNGEEFPYRQVQLMKRYQNDMSSLQIDLDSQITKLRVPCLRFEYLQ